LITDLHLGLDATCVYYNRLLGPQAEPIATAALQTLNQSGADLTIILGDITHDGRTSDLTLTRELFSRLKMPWFVLPGNHDTDAVKSGAFDQIFGEHAAQGYVRRGDIGMLFVRDAHPEASCASESFLVGPSQAASLIAAAAQDPAPLLFLFAHAPLLSAQAYAEEQGGPYPGHFTDGAAFLNQLAARCTPRKPFVFNGHLHFHHIQSHPSYAQCATASLIEYPMDYRRVTVTPTRMIIETLPAVPPELSKQSLCSPTSAWVAGRPQDRRHEEILA